jgi:hypothetical protein
MNTSYTIKQTDRQINKQKITGNKQSLRREDKRTGKPETKMSLG